MRKTREIFPPYEEGKAFDALRALLASPRPPLALVGSGASIKSGYPTWEQMTDELRGMAGREAKQPRRQGVLAGDFAWEAEVHRQAMGKAKFEGYLRNRFKETQVVAEPHPQIAAMPFRHFLTTNYDPCIELALEKIDGHRPKPVSWDEPDALSRFLIGLSSSNPIRRVVYLHGRHDRPKDIILTESSYVERYVKNDDARRKLLAIFMTHPVVFIGFSMNDPDLSNLMREVTARLATNPPSHFVIMSYESEPEREIYRNRMRGKFGVEPIFYSKVSSGGPRHGNLSRLLEALAPGSRRGGEAAFQQSAASEKPDVTVVPPKRDPSDPEKNQWGGQPEANGRRVKVVKRGGSKSDGYLEFDIIVEAVRGARPLVGDVAFKLHPTFTPDVHVVKAKDGRAVLEECDAYGAFTIGVAADGNDTRLELDLALLPELPEWFRRR